MKPGHVINIHGHLRHDQDIPERIRIWEEWNVRRFCCACLVDHWAQEDRRRYFGNEDFLAAKEKFGDILVGLAGVNLSKDELATPADIERYRALGFEGLKFIDPYYPYSHETYFPLYEKAEQLGMPILFHTGWVAWREEEAYRRARVDSDNMRPYKFDKIARAFPNLKMIGAHLGLPHAREALQMAIFPNVYFDICGGSGRKEHVREILTALLPHAALETDMSNPEENRALKWFEKFVFGTDNPEPSVWIPAAEAIMDRLEIPPETRREFYFGNAAKLFGWSDL